MRIIGEEFAHYASQATVAGGLLAAIQRTSCPICGHPTGDCTPDTCAAEQHVPVTHLEPSE